MKASRQGNDSPETPSANYRSEINRARTRRQERKTCLPDRIYELRPKRNNHLDKHDESTFIFKTSGDSNASQNASSMNAENGITSDDDSNETTSAGNTSANPSEGNVSF